MVAKNLIALFMMNGLRGATRVAAICKPSFISLNGKAAGRNIFSGRALAPVDAFFGRYEYSLVGRTGRIKSRTFLRESSPFTTATHTGASNTNDYPFTWPQLKKLFQDPDTPKNQDDYHIPSDHPNLPLYRRSIAAQALYEQHKNYLDDNWRSPYDFLVVSKLGERFGFEKVLVNTIDSENTNTNRIGDNCKQNNNNKCSTPDGYVYQARPSLTQASKYTIENGITYLRLVLNDFPYDVDEGIEHWCLWKIGGTCSTEGITREELTWALKELPLLKADGKSGSGCIITEGQEPAVSFRDTSESSTIPRIDLDTRTFYWVNPPHLQSMPEIHHAHILALRPEKKNINEAFAQKNEVDPSHPPL